MNSGHAEKLRILGEMHNRMFRAWSPALKDRLMNIYLKSIEERKHLSSEDIEKILGFDPANIDELKPPWRNPEF